MLKERIKADLTEAMKASKKDVVEVLRSVLTAFTVKEKETGTAELDQAEQTAVVIKQVKDRKNSIEQFTAGNRPDLVEKEQKQIDILSVYLPQPFTEEEVEAKIKEIIATNGYAGKANMRNVIGDFNKLYAGQADGAMVSKTAARLL
jgi:uncharacterized protein